MKVVVGTGVGGARSGTILPCRTAGRHRPLHKSALSHGKYFRMEFKGRSS